MQVLPVSALEDARALQQPRAVLRADDLRVLERAVLPHLAGRRRGRRGVGRGRRGAVAQVLTLGRTGASLVMSGGECRGGVVAGLEDGQVRVEEEAGLARAADDEVEVVEPAGS